MLAKEIFFVLLPTLLNTYISFQIHLHFKSDIYSAKYRYHYSFCEVSYCNAKNTAHYDKDSPKTLINRKK